MYLLNCTPLGDVCAGQYLDPNGIGILADDPGLVAWLAAGNIAQPSVACVQRCTAEQFILALRDLNLLATWHAGLAKAKQSDLDRWSLCRADKVLLINNPVLTRIAALGPVDLPTVFTKAQSE